MNEICEQLDSLVLNIFQVLEEVYQKQDRLEQAMKDGFLGISRTRYSLGVKRVCTDQFIDAELRASRTVKVNEDALNADKENSESLDSEIFVLNKSDYVNSRKETKEKILGRNSSDEYASGSSGLRQRNISKVTGKQENDEENSREKPQASKTDQGLLKDRDGEENDDDEDAKIVGNPIKLFGVLVPQHLRNSQKSFEEAVELCVCISNLKSKLGTLQTQYKTLKNRKEKLKYIDSSSKSDSVKNNDQLTENEA